MTDPADPRLKHWLLELQKVALSGIFGHGSHEQAHVLEGGLVVIIKCAC